MERRAMDFGKRGAWAAALALLLAAGCGTVDPPADDRKAGGSTGCGNPDGPCTGKVALGFARTLDGTVSLYEAGQNPLLDSVPLARFDLAGADSFALDRSRLDSILASAALDSVRGRPVPPELRVHAPADSLRFNLVIFTRDSAEEAFLPGWRYDRDSGWWPPRGDSGWKRVEPAAVAEYRGAVALGDKVRLPPDPDDYRTYFYVPGSPHRSPLAGDSLFDFRAAAGVRWPHPTLMVRTRTGGGPAAPYERDQAYSLGESGLDTLGINSGPTSLFAPMGQL